VCCSPLKQELSGAAPGGGGQGPPPKDVFLKNCFGIVKT